MRLIHEIKRKLEEGVSSFEVRGEISDPTWAEISVTNNTGSPVLLGTPLDNVKFRAQILISGAPGFSQGNYRLDNSHNLPIHQHFGEQISSANVQTISSALLMILGSDYQELERTLN